MSILKFLWVLCVILVTTEVRAQVEIEKWGVFEQTLKGPESGNPFTDIELTAWFVNGNDTVEVQGFYDGDGRYMFRFSPDNEGVWKYRTSSNVKKLDGRTGDFRCIPARTHNHGPVDVRDTFRFSYRDGTPYVCVGTTLYAWVHQGDSLAEVTLNTLSRGYFNKVRMCIFPKAYWWNQNEPEMYPFEGEPLENWDYSRFNPTYFQNIEQRIQQLDSLGIQADLIVFHPYDRWGFSKMDSLTDDRYIRYIIARFSAYKNVWWSMANEFDFLENKTMEDWDRYIRLFAERDPHQRLRGIHNGIAMYDHTNPLLTHASIQMKEVERGKELRNTYKKPVVFDECLYEGNVPWFWGQLTPEEMVQKFWEGAVNGVYVGHGETYLTTIRTDVPVQENDDVLWWSKGGVLKGKSPDRILFLRQMLESGAGSKEDSPDDYLIYLGTHQPALHLLEFTEGIYDIDIIDTWNMTISKSEKEYSGYSLIRMPQRPYMALRVTRKK